MNEPLDYKLMDSIVVCINDTAGFGRKAFESFSLATDVARTWASMATTQMI